MNTLMKNFQHAEFIKSAANINQSPPDHGIEVACVGRSNAGKSSLINTLCHQNRLAKTSKTPGRTQLINFYHLAENKRLVDLPGYGYAKIDDRTKKIIQNLLHDYLNDRLCLRGLIVVMDIRHPLTPLDQQLIEMAAQLNLNVHIVLTKSDKLKRGPVNNTTLQVQKALRPYENVSVQSFSASAGYGLEALQDKLSTWFEL